MQLKKKLMVSGIIAAATLMASIFIPIVPCRSGANVPNPIYQWSTCSLNPDKISSIGHIVEYFGYTSSLRDTYILILLLTFAVAMGFMALTARNKNKH